MYCWSLLQLLPLFLFLSSCHSQPITNQTSPCSGVSCPIGLQCCNGQCFDSNQYMCFVQPRTGSEQLCPMGLQLCGDACYDRTRYSCNYNGEFYLEPVIPTTGCVGVTCQQDQQCCSKNSTSHECFKPTDSCCCNDPYISQLNIVCGVNARGRALGCCGPYYVEVDPSTGFVAPTVQCYDPDTQFCCHGCSPGGCVGIVCNLNDTTCCPRRG